MGRFTRWMLLGLLASGCVPKGRYELTAVQLEATRTALDARTGQSTTDQVQCDARIEELQAEITDRQAQLDELVARAALHEEDHAEHVGRQAALLAELAALKGELKAVRAELAELRDDGAPDDDGDDDSPWDAPPSDDPVDVAVAEMATAMAAWEAAELEAAREAAAHTALVGALSPIVEEGNGEMLRRDGATVLRVPTDKLYQEGWTTLSARGEKIVGQIDEALRIVPGRAVSLEGHTDDAPVHSVEFPSNWERGFKRAMGVLRQLEALGTPATMSAASFADTRPAVPHDSDGASEINARVELVIAFDPGLLEAFAPTPDEEEEPEEEEVEAEEVEAEADPESPWGPTD